MRHILIKEDTPFVSIVVPAYNAQKFIGQTLDSLVKQQLNDIEIIVVNDGSTDETENVVKQFFFDRRLKYFKKDNGGTGSALNLGHKEARGRYVTWCSADNIYLPHFAISLATALQQCEMESVPISYVYSDFMYIDEGGRKIHDVIHNKPQSKEDLMNGYDLGISFMYTKELWDKAGPYWNDICEDYEWSTRAAQFTHFGLIKEVLAAFRVHGGQITGSNKEREVAAAEFCRNQARNFYNNGKYGTKEFKPVLVED